MKKLAVFVAALVLALGLAQCKKEQPATPQNTEGNLVHLTVNVGASTGSATNGSRANIDPSNGVISFSDGDKLYVGVYQPRDGRDHLLYELPATGLSLWEAIPAVRNKVNTTDLNGPSAQPYWAKGMHVYSAELWFE